MSRRSSLSRSSASAAWRRSREAWHLASRSRQGRSQLTESPRNPGRFSRRVDGGVVARSRHRASPGAVGDRRRPVRPQPGVHHAVDGHQGIHPSVLHMTHRPAGQPVRERVRLDCPFSPQLGQASPVVIYQRGGGGRRHPAGRRLGRQRGSASLSASSVQSSCGPIPAGS